MRRPSDLPRRTQRRRRFGARSLLIGVGAFLLIVLVFGRAIARFYVDYLWHKGLGRGDVFWGTLEAKFTLFIVFLLVFVAIAGVNLVIADRLAPASFPANVHPYVERFHELFGRRLRLVRYGAALVLAVLLALPAVAHWQEWLLFRHRQSFGISDPQFDADVGFYVFELPFLSFVMDWLFAAMVVVLILVVAAHVLNGGVVFTAPVPKVRSATKSHIAVVLAVLAVLKAADYWLLRYDLTNERRGFVQGATYAVVKAQLPAVMLLVLVALLTAGLYLFTLRSGSWRLPVVASGLWFVIWIVGGFIYPSLVQSLVVNPNQESREAPYIDRNIRATRHALGIDNVIPAEIVYGDLNAADIEDDLEPLRNVRLLEPDEFESRFRFDRGNVAGLTIADLDPDRYDLDGKRQQVMVAARELDIANIPNKTWQSRHLINTRGCGLVMAPVSRVLEAGQPDYREVELDRPELYFSPNLSNYAIARSDQDERECGDGTTYAGTNGVQMSSFVRRAAVSLAFLDYNVMFSGAINSDSQMLWVRDVRDRVEKLAPFLSYDGDPYPVAIGGKALWVIDAYTSSSHYPYGQAVGQVQLTADSGLPRDANYVRNSVKAVVDAYDGTTVFYVVDDTDPIVAAWRDAFPGLFRDRSDMPAELLDHLRYPEDLFRVQTDKYSKYQISPEQFFERRGAWSLAPAPSATPRESAGGTVTTTPAPESNSRVGGSEFATDSKSARFEPYYTLFRNAAGEFEFVLLRPFEPFSPDDRFPQLQAFMTASSDPETYGQLTSHIVTGVLPDGPARAANRAESEPDISREITFQNQEGGGTTVKFGDQQLVPIADGLIYVRPFYVEVPQQQSAVSELRFIIVSHEGTARYDTTLSGALAQLFPGFDVDVGDRVGGAPDDDGTDGSVPDEPDQQATAAELLANAETLFDEAETALRAGDLAEYQAKIEQARAAVTRALDLLDVEPGG